MMTQKLNVCDIFASSFCVG